MEKLQKIQDAFAKANEVASTLTYTDGVPITVPSNHSKVCSLIRATEKGRQNCIFSGLQLGKKAGESQIAIYHHCYNIGLTDAAAPIIVKGRHIANWLIGQYHVSTVDESRVREYAGEIGTGPEEMVRVFEKMPQLTIDRFKKKLDFLDVMANELSLMGYQNLMQRQQNAELNRIQEQLEKHQLQLEDLVTQRTAALQQTNRQLTNEIKQKIKIQKRQKMLITAIDSAAESIVITSTAGKIIYVNSAFERLTGYSSREVVEKTPQILKSGFHDENFDHNLWQSILSGKMWVGRLTNKKKNGTFYQEESTISPVKNARGKIVNFVAVKKDITKEIELERQLHQAQKFESIGTLAAGMAHEINSPIQYVLGNTQFLKEVLNNFAELQTSHEKLLHCASTSGVFTEQVDEIFQLSGEMDLELHMLQEIKWSCVCRITGPVFQVPLSTRYSILSSPQSR